MVVTALWERWGWIAFHWFINSPPEQVHTYTPRKTASPHLRCIMSSERGRLISASSAGDKLDQCVCLAVMILNLTWIHCMDNLPTGTGWSSVIVCWILSLEFCIKITSCVSAEHGVLGHATTTTWSFMPLTWEVMNCVTSNFPPLPCLPTTHSYVSLMVVESSLSPSWKTAEGV